MASQVVRPYGFSFSMNYSLLLLLWFPLSIYSDDLTNSQKCWFRCTASCLNKHKGANPQDCLTECRQYDSPQLCEPTDEKCWSKCKDLKPAKPLGVPDGFHMEQKNLTSAVAFQPVPDATFYVVQHKLRNDVDWLHFEISLQPVFSMFQKPEPIFCDAIEIRVAAVSSSGTGPFSAPFLLDPPRPLVNPKLHLQSMVYLNTPLTSEFYSANGTVEITFQYEAGAWPLGVRDLDVVPMFHLITCAEPDLSQGVPLPEFIKGPRPNTLVGRLGSDMMYRKCRFVYYAQSISSRRCATRTEIRSPPPGDLQTLLISCDTVQGNPCVKVDYFQPPICGQINDIQYKVIKKYHAPGEKEYRVDLNITFDPITRENEPPTIYYQAFYGEALPYPRKEEEALAGVNMTRVLGNTSNCVVFDANGFCLENSGHNVNISGVHFDKLYGITFCAVKDPRNLTIPDLTQNNRAFKPRAHKIFVDSKEYASAKVGMIIGIVVGAVAALVLGIIAVCCYINRKQKQENKLYQLKLAQLEREKGCRYVDFPKKHDIWEIERRNLIIFDEVKLGSGAFGAVYLGKLLGKSLASKDATSPLGVNLMRAENCQVAVKMLPEYADDLSRSDFLREIGLMKTLGYHERLVNMLACITESEPLCLIVEYCSDGDLLRFLRERCKYMMKLDAAGINYHEPPVDDNYDIEMVITLKQLLMFAVQISYGLEYLSSKGFVHRDVAARNVLVNGKNACKIGDFGLCRNLYSDSSLYKSKGGRLPLKWMSPEAIRHYEFSMQSDVWAFGVLLFEVITLGGSPYPSVPPEDMLHFLESGGRMERPDNCPENFYEVMCECWTVDPEKRPDFSTIRQKLAGQLEEITEEYSYLTLDAQKDYYNVQYGDQKPDVIVIPETESIKAKTSKQSVGALSIDTLPIDDVMTRSDDVDAATQGDVARRRDPGAVSLTMGVDNIAYKGDSL
ncbi:hypothetical protein Y032_0042g576 [Ancylostoma ceylanicum]|uniref:Protein kinase domain-containing protein n=1 Tax=Ancylostoma ceylanicum TaxID=53326 RepID=A0A016UFC2_9BILA|nr:hypothetical protein Y032_0042g576 [Ancylostoma ceylanicum]